MWSRYGVAVKKPVHGAVKVKAVLQWKAQVVEDSRDMTTRNGAHREWNRSNREVKVSGSIAVCHQRPTDLNQHHQTRCHRTGSPPSWILVCLWSCILPNALHHKISAVCFWVSLLLTMNHNCLKSHKKFWSLDIWISVRLKEYSSLQSELSAFWFTLQLWLFKGKEFNFVLKMRIIPCVLICFNICAILGDIDSEVIELIRCRALLYESSCH